MLVYYHMIYLLVLLFLLEETNGKVEKQNQQHTSNWAVLVDTSRFWFNYRHIANTLSLYHSVKQLGIPDSHIILMLADQMPCNARNCYPGEVFNNLQKNTNLYGDDVEVDYRGLEVSVASFIKVLTGRHDPDTPLSRRLDSDENSNILIYMTGHGGKDFLKFQDFEEISSYDIADAIEEMHVKGRYKELLFMVDTCQAGSLPMAFRSPQVVSIASSKPSESSYAHHSDPTIGVSVIDRFTSSTLDFLSRVNAKTATLADLFGSYRYENLYSHVDIRSDLIQRKLNKIPITDFFGSSLDIHGIHEIFETKSNSTLTKDQESIDNILDNRDFPYLLSDDLNEENAGIVQENAEHNCFFSAIASTGIISIIVFRKLFG